MSVRLSENNTTSTYTLLKNYFQSIQNVLTQFIRQPELRIISESKKLDQNQVTQTTIELDKQVKKFISLSHSNNAPFEFIQIHCKNGFTYRYGSHYESPYDDFASCEQYYMERGIIDHDYSPAVWGDFALVKSDVGFNIPVLINIRGIYDSVTLERIGIIISAIPEEHIYNIYSGFTEDALLLFHDGTLFSGQDKKKLGEKLEDKALQENVLNSAHDIGTISYKDNRETKLVSFHKPFSDYVYLVVPFDYYNGVKNKEIRQYIVFTIFIAFTSMTLGIIFAFLISKGLSHSIENLKGIVQQVNDGDLNARYDSSNSPPDEISYLGQSFNEMLNRINSLFKQQEQNIKIQHNLELKLLQSQINPHLLYNTLDSVLWALQTGENNNAESIIVSLSQFFKISLSSGDNLIPLKNEIALIDSYINIQCLAREKNITIRYNICEDLLSYRIIKLSIQPLVENAIIHGFSGYRDDGTIIVSAQVKDKKLVLTIEDNGIGIMEDELLRINSFLSTYPPRSNMKHFGLYNINRRIKNIFGDSYNVVLESEMGNYTRVIMTIPYRYQSQFA
ncbi:MAG: histidine kinase [Clostridiales bacterium]|nr:histidine kinase [Clostridiales bacterium]